MQGSLYNLVELCFQQGQRGVPIDEEFAQNVLSNAQIRYDKGGDEHYNVISAFIKSIRGSDPQAAVYYLARMIEGGEDVKFIARRLIISAAEDIGLANPNALMLANETFSAVERVGWPESRIILSQCTIYLATSPKSNSAYTAIGKAQKLVQQTGNLEVPDHLKNASSTLAKDLGHGKGLFISSRSSRRLCASRILTQRGSRKCVVVPGIKCQRATDQRPTKVHVER